MTSLFKRLFNNPSLDDEQLQDVRKERERQEQQVLDELVPPLPAGGCGPVTAVVVGCGQRGSGYATFALDFPNHLTIVAAVDPVQSRLQKMKTTYGLSEDKLFQDWESLAKVDKIADFAMVCVQDRMHFPCASALAKKGK